MLLLLTPALSLAQTPTPTPLWEIDAEDADAYINRGLAYYYQGDYEQTIEDWEMYLKLAPNAAGRAQVEAWIEELKSQQ